MALTELLTQIADSIRAKDGTADAIQATDFPQRILDIPSGGEGSGSAFDVITGKIILDEDHNLYDSANQAENNLVINHAIGRMPSMFFLYLDTDGIIGNVPLSTVNFTMLTTPVRLTPAANANYQIISRINSATNSNGANNLAAVSREFVVADEDNITIGKSITAANYIFRAGYTYRWIALVERGR